MAARTMASASYFSVCRAPSLGALRDSIRRSDPLAVRWTLTRTMRDSFQTSIASDAAQLPVTSHDASLSRR